MSELFDPGLQPERTKLAWQRTVLSIGLGSLVYARVAATSIGVWAWFLAGVGLIIAMVTGIQSRHRYDYTHRSLSAGFVQLPDGLLPAVLAASVGAGGAPHAGAVVRRSVTTSGFARAAAPEGRIAPDMPNQ